MLKEQRCNLCGSLNQAMVYEAPDAQDRPVSVKYSITEADIRMPRRIVRCQDCGLTFASPMQRWEELKPAYTDMEDEEYVREAAGRRLSCRRLLKKIESVADHRSGNKLLDIGCGTGFLLDEARKRGWDVSGVEISQWAVGYATQRLGLKIYNTEIKDADLPDKSFDVIILQDVIEHLTDPKSALVKIRRLLKTDGVLYVNTPDIESLPSRLLKARWWGINRFHLYYFSKKTLYAMLEAAGFRGISCSAHPRVFSLRYWLERFRYYNSSLHRVSSFIIKRPFFSSRLITVNLYDQIGVFARRSRKLEYLHELEEEPKRPQAAARKKVIVLPAYNAARTLKVTFDDIPKDAVDEIILVDDASQDDTLGIARALGITAFSHGENKGYGANQKTCFTKALEAGADIVVMVHPDYQYDPRAIPELIAPIERGVADAVFGSRMMKGGALIGGMPLWKRNANIILTALENVVFNTYLTEYHSGFRAYGRRFLERARFEDNSDSFVFDTEIIAQALLQRLKIEEIPIRTRYFDEASSIRFFPCLIYGLGILKVLLRYILHTHGIIRFRQFEARLYE